MRKWKLAAAATVASGVLAAGMFAAFTLTAKAGTVAGTGCEVTPTTDQTTALTCTATDTAADGTAIAYPISVSYTAYTSTSTDSDLDANLPVEFKWDSTCTEPSGAQVSVPATSTTGTASTTDSPPVLTLDANNSSDTSTSMNAIDPTTCDVTVVVTVTGSTAATELDVSVSVNQSAAASTSPTPSASTSSASSTSTTKTYTNQVHGFDGTCLDDKGNSSGKRAEVIIWGCNDTDQAQGWTYSGSELKIHGMCLNAKGNGKTGSKLILWSCTGSGNEIFSHNSHDEFVEKANGWSLCIDDPGYSTKNGTQPFMYKCNNGANQHWSKP